MTREEHRAPQWRGAAGTLRPSQSVANLQELTARSSLLGPETERALREDSAATAHGGSNASQGVALLSAAGGAPQVSHAAAQGAGGAHHHAHTAGQALPSTPEDGDTLARDEDSGNVILRQRIRRIQSDNDIPALEKARKIQSIMSEKWVNSRAQEVLLLTPCKTSGHPVQEEPVDREISWHLPPGHLPASSALAAAASDKAGPDMDAGEEAGTATSRGDDSDDSERDWNRGNSLDQPRAPGGRPQGGESADHLRSRAQESMSEDGKENAPTPSEQREKLLEGIKYRGGILGCKHYMRGCKLRAECCGRFFTCRFCHDEMCDHGIDRYATRKMLCMRCGECQPAGRQCANEACGAVLGHYYCDICRFWDDDVTKSIYHCPYCKLCRIGKGLGIDYFHCHKCNACMSIEKKVHQCVERALESNCPICHEFMFTSTTPVMFLNCGHCIHSSCLDMYLNTNYTCPVCSKSLADMTGIFKQIDDLLTSEMPGMPDEYKNVRTRVLCSDCEQKTMAPFHFVYHKCTNCSSYNTKVVEYVDRDGVRTELPSPPDHRPSAEGEGGSSVGDVPMED